MKNLLQSHRTLHTHTHTHTYKYCGNESEIASSQGLLNDEVELNYSSYKEIPACAGMTEYNKSRMTLFNIKIVGVLFLSACFFSSVADAARGNLRNSKTNRSGINTVSAQVAPVSQQNSVDYSYAPDDSSKYNLNYKTDIKNKSFGVANNNAALQAEYSSKVIYLEQLKQQQSEIAENKKACDKARKGWIAGTVIGGAGVVGTAIGAIVQGKKVKESKYDISDKKSQISGLDSDIDNVNQSILQERSK